MKKSQMMVLGLLFIFALIGGWLAFKTIAANHYRARLDLAQEIHKALNAMMLDLSHVKASSIQGVPADGKWYHAISFNSRSETLIRYQLDGPNNDELMRSVNSKRMSIANRLKELNFRRTPADALILEVQVQAKNSLTLTSNFKIRLVE